jgi:DNA adenine methylase
MKYVGGKGLIATWIRDNILNVRGDTSIYVEPFLGSAATFYELAPFFKQSVACDAHEDLISMWRGLADGWIPPTTLSRAEYHRIRALPTCALRGFAGFGCSFGGKFFGGYARAVFGNRNYCAEVARSVVERKRALMGSTILCGDYSLVTPYATRGSLVYCDPPYADTQGYATGWTFGAERFWDTARRWGSNGAIVVVSEEQAPNDWRCFAQCERRLTLDGRNKRKRVEKLFIRRSQ